MINTGDKLLCTDGNAFFVKGQVYTVGSIINEQFFEIKTGCDDEHWYATKDSEGIYIRFNSAKGKVSDAWFSKVKSKPTVDKSFPVQKISSKVMGCSS